MGRKRGRKREKRRGEWVERLAVQMSVRLAFWLSRVAWGTREVVGIGSEILRRVEGGRWGDIRGLREGLLVVGGGGEGVDEGDIQE